MSNILCLYWGNPTFYPYITEKLKYLKRKKRGTVYFISRSYKDYFYKKNFLKSLCESFSIWHLENKILHVITFILFILLSFYILIFKNIKVVILYDRNATVFFFVAKILRKKIIYHNFDYNDQYISLKKGVKLFLIQKIEKICAKYSDLLIFSHDFRAKKFLLNNRIKKKYIVAYNGPTLDNKFNIKKISKKKNVIWTGTLGKGHSLENIIRSFNFLSNKINLTIVCHYIFSKDEYLNYLNKLIIDNNLSDRIKIYTTFTYKKFIKQLNKSHIGLAIYEPTNLSHKYIIGASNKINFYMKYSLPIILSTIDEQINFINKYKNGFNVNYKNPKSIALAIKKILNNSTNYKKMSLNSFEAFKNEFNFYEKFKIIENFLNE
jgi:glycosyltransferase involved in cell wall biosynthesis